MLKLINKPFPILSPSKLIRKRKIDHLYKDLSLANSKKSNIAENKIKKFYHDYLKCLETKKINTLEKYMEPRFYYNLKDYLKIRGSILNFTKLRDFEECENEIEIEFNGSMKVYGVNINRTENEIYNNYTFLKEDNLLEFININQAMKMITADNEDDQKSFEEKNAKNVLQNNQEFLVDKLKNFFFLKKPNESEKLDYDKMTLKKKLEIRFQQFQKRDYILIEEFIIRAPLYMIPEFKTSMNNSPKNLFNNNLDHSEDNKKDIKYFEHFIRIENFVDSKETTKTLANKEINVIDFDDFMFGNPHYNAIDYIK